VTIASRGFTGQGPTSFAGGASRFARALPQPDPLGHLLSRNRCSIGWRLRCRRRHLAGNQLGSRLARSRHTSLAPAKGRARVPPMARLREAAGPEGREDQSGADDANATRGRGPHHPFFREEERDQPHPRCLPSMSRLAASRSAEASPLMTRGSPARASSDRGLELSTGCHQPVDNTCAFGDPARSAILDGIAGTMNG